jgi:hypothetical protein
MSEESVQFWKSIFINFFSRLDMGRDVIEDALDEALGDKGEVIGGGSGVSGSNIDIEILEGEPHDFLEIIRTVLRELEAPNDTVIVIGDERFSLY